MVILVILYNLVGGYSVPLDEHEDICYIEPDIVLVDRYIIIGEDKEKMYEGVRGRYAITSYCDGCYL